MIAHIEKTVFISYRRTNLPWAITIYQNLAANGFDVFFDYNSIKSGDFEQIIVQNVKGRAHFVVLLTPSALERCSEPGDWLRHEIELAIDEKRNIVPLFFEGFSFSNPSVSKYLTGNLELLKKYNGMTVPAEYFEAAMSKLRNEFLSVPLNTVLHPVSNKVEKAVKVQQSAANNATKVRQEVLTSQEWFEKGVYTSNLDEKIYFYSEAIKLNPDDAGAYNNRGNAYRQNAESEKAIIDFNTAIRLQPDFELPYNNRALEKLDNGDNDGAIDDATNAIRLKSDYSKAYNTRGLAYMNKGNKEEALANFNEAIRFNSNNAEAINNLGVIYLKRGDLDEAIKNFSKAININPNLDIAYGGRGDVWWRKKDYPAALKDYQKYLDLGGEKTQGVIKRINEAKKMLGI